MKEQSKEKQLQGCGQVCPGYLSGSTVKGIAMITMLIDHLAAAAVCPAFSGGTVLYHVCRQIGRVSFPLFCFLLVEGFVHTHSRRSYGCRLLLFAFLSETPFDLAFYDSLCSFQKQNVFFTLFLGLVALCVLECLVENGRYNLVLLPVLGSGLAACLLRTDYHCFGVFLITVIYWFREVSWKRNIAVAASCIWEPASILALLPMQLYNGKRGWSLKYFFYMFYPLHLLFLWFVRTEGWFSS